MAEQIGNEATLLRAHVGIGGALHRTGELAEALAHYEQVIAIAERAAITVGIVAAARAAADVAEARKDRDRAHALRDRAARAEAEGRAVTTELPRERRTSIGALGPSSRTSPRPGS